jgi:hypothetical protein
MSTLEKFIEQGQTSQAADRQSIVLDIRKLSVNKDLRIFLTSLCKYSKRDWAELMKTCRTIYSVMQSSIMIKEDSDLMDELVKTPHIAMFFRRLTEEDA